MSDLSNKDVAKELELLFPNSQAREFRRASAGLYQLFKIIRDRNGLGEIVIPNLCCETVALAAMFAGHKVRFAEVDDKRFCVTPDSLKQVMGPSTRAVVVVHLFGLTLDASIFSKLRSENPKVIFIEDVAHAAGSVSENGLEVGSNFDHTLFSFSSSKILRGEGGAIVSFRKDDVSSDLHNSDLRSLYKKVDPLLTLSLRNFVHALADLHRAGSQNASAQICPSFWERFRPVVASNGPFLNADTAIDDLRNRFNIQKRRRSRVMKYANAIRNPNFSIPYYSETETCWRLPILALTPELCRRATDALRREQLNASNHYFPLNRLFHEEQLNVSESVGDRVINLWVDDSISDQAINSTARAINSL